MKFLEKDLEEIIFNSNYHELQERGLNLADNITLKKRQLRIGNYGIADIVCYSKPLKFERLKFYPEDKLITVIELKKDTVNVNTFLQAVKYVRGIQRWIEINKPDFGYYKLKMVLIGRKFNSGDFCYLPNMFDSENSIDLSVYTYNYDIDGIYFEQHYNYKLIEEGF